jgi:hypothetical protein
MTHSRHTEPYRTVDIAHLLFIRGNGTFYRDNVTKCILFGTSYLAQLCYRPQRTALGGTSRGV